MNAPLSATHTTRPTPAPHWQTAPVEGKRRGIPFAGHSGTPGTCPLCSPATWQAPRLATAPRAPVAAAVAPLVVVPAPAPAAPRMRRHRVALAARPALDLSTLTVRELILVAAVELSATTPGIDMLALVVRAWTIAPERFGFTIDGTNYPHTNRVLAKLAGPDGLCGLGWLESTARSTYRVTIRGARTAARLGARGAA